MGFRFSLKNANAVGHLVDGNVETFLHESIRSSRIFDQNIEFIDYLINEPREALYTTAQYWTRIRTEYEWLRYEWNQIRLLYRKVAGRLIAHNSGAPREAILSEIEILRQDPIEHQQLLNFFNVLSGLLSRCKIKTMLLPGSADDLLNEAMISPGLLKDLVQIHPGKSALILQMQEKPEQEDTYLFNNFSKFEQAYINFDSWPGILIWNKKDSLFLGVENITQVREIFEILRAQSRPISYLRENIQFQRKRDRQIYVFHLSDLHLGKVEPSRPQRLLNILSKHRKEVPDDITALPLITGDLMETTDPKKAALFSEFSNNLEDIGFAKPIYVLGNHDVRWHGLSGVGGKGKIATSALLDSKVEVLEDFKLAVLKFNSNIGGLLARGKIGTTQLESIGNELDRKRITGSDFTLIAMLHHHPKQIETPEWYAKTWYEKLFGPLGFEKTLELTDAELFLKWSEKRNINLVLHGHKHIPQIQLYNNIKIVGAGSSTGKIKHQDNGKTFLTYNLIKLDLKQRKPVSAAIIAEDIGGSGDRNMKIINL